MISDPSLVTYACVARGATILAEFTAGDADLETLALKCVENAPPLHAMFSQTCRQRTYTFVMDASFTYFGIFHESLGKSQGLWFLGRVKDASEEVVESESIKKFDNLMAYSLQGELNPVFRELLAPPPPPVPLPPPPGMHPSPLKSSWSVSSELPKGKKMVSVPLLGKPAKGLKKKKRLVGEGAGEGKDLASENKVVDVSDDVGVMTRSFSVSLQKNVLFDGGRQKAKQKWKQHVWVVLGLDVVVCSLLFGIWLWICRGFKCIDG